MSGGKRPYHHGDLPRALVDASLDLVDRQGVDGFSLRAAARGAGVNPSAVYRHFTDRAELLGAVAAAGFADLGERMTEAVDGVGDPRSRFRATGEAYVRSALDRPDRFRLMFGPYGSLPGSAGRLTADTGRPGPYARLVGVLDDLAQAGDLDGRPEDTAHRLVHRARARDAAGRPRRRARPCRRRHRGRAPRRHRPARARSLTGPCTVRAARGRGPPTGVVPRVCLGCPP